MYEHFNWAQDCMTIVIPKHKGDQEGKVMMIICIELKKQLIPETLFCKSNDPRDLPSFVISHLYFLDSLEPKYFEDDDFRRRKQCQ